LLLAACGGAASGPASPAIAHPAPKAQPATKLAPAPVCKASKRVPSPPPRCQPPPREAIVTSGDDKLQLSRALFSDLPGWRKDKHADALVAFLASCVKLNALDKDAPVGTGPYGGRAGQWRKACAAAAAVPEGHHKKARRFFEKEFKVYATRGSRGSKGKITGYYVQPLRASRKRGGRYQFPLYRRPDDLVAVSLSDFVEDGRSRRIWGRMNDKGTKLVPYPARLEFRQAHAGSDDHVLLWVDDPADAVQVEIEGSGRALLDDGSVVMVAFAGKNGRKSGKLGTIARAMRALSKEEGPGPWSKAALARYQKIADEKTSMVFFEIESRNGAIGSQNVVLTPRRSLAVDRAVVSLSTPVWVETRAPKAGKGPIVPFRQLLIAQDTGGAIVGTMRGDIYWGDDQDAVAIGKRVNNSGRMWLLLPRSLRVRTSAP
jgi:membrane-bound lytic murein transglycosylase A